MAGSSEVLLSSFVLSGAQVELTNKVKVQQ